MAGGAGIRNACDVLAASPGAVVPAAALAARRAARRAPRVLHLGDGRTVDLSGVYRPYRVAGRRHQPFDPRTLINALLYATLPMNPAV